MTWRDFPAFGAMKVNSAGECLENTAMVEAIFEVVGGERRPRLLDTENLAPPEETILGMRRRLKTSDGGRLLSAAARLLLKRHGYLKRNDALTVASPEVRAWALQRIELGLLQGRTMRERHGVAPETAARAVRDLQAAGGRAGVELFLAGQTLREAALHGGFRHPQEELTLGFVEKGGLQEALAEALAEDPAFSAPLVSEGRFLRVRHAHGALMHILPFREDEQRRALYFLDGDWRQYHSRIGGTVPLETADGAPPVPENHEIWLEEEFGNWRGETFLQDPVLDNPNRVPGAAPGDGADELRALRVLAEESIREGRESRTIFALERLKEEHGVDFTGHLPVSRRRDEIPVPLIWSDAWKNRTPQPSLFVLGVFDGLTETIPALADEARGAGQFVIFGVLDDDLAREKLGIAPRYDLGERMAMLSMMRGIDAILPVRSLEEVPGLMKCYECAGLIREDETWPLDV